MPGTLPSRKKPPDKRRTLCNVDDNRVFIQTLLTVAFGSSDLLDMQGPNALPQLIDDYPCLRCTSHTQTEQLASPAPNESVTVTDVALQFSALRVRSFVFRVLSFCFLLSVFSIFYSLCSSTMTRQFTASHKHHQTLMLAFSPFQLMIVSCLLHCVRLFL